ncbi:lymphocyte function-associated antigen 3 [Athene cunicularia]|uniref:lymphocyte function-associated antigen 3 n=1 Tax=Athene cunicularia TaxID=194338 RepID=UPI000EF69C70|nr:lymphocyte function-associated antigen 3 [Athene cunicularia]
MKPPALLRGLPFLVSLLAHIRCDDVFGVLGENFTFPVKIDQAIMEIIWTKNKDKVAEWEGQGETTYFPSFQYRSLLSKENGSLTIFNLEYSDAGTYVLDCLDSRKKNHVLTFILAVLAPPSEPEINCNITGDKLVLKCTADFQKPLNYVWKFSSNKKTHQTQEVSTNNKDVDISEKAAYFIKFSQTEKSSEISLIQCYPDGKGDSYNKRSRGAVIAVSVLFIAAVGIAVAVYLYRKGRTKLGTEKAAQNSLAPGSEDRLLCPVDRQEQPNLERAISSQTVDCENEKPKAEPSAMQNSTLTSTCAADCGVTEGDTLKENSSLLAEHGDDCGVNEAEVTQDAEGGNGEHLSNSSSCSK